jgi:hypothetical protein
VTTSCEESQFVQYLSAELFRDARFVQSGFTAGCGRVSFGANFRMKADCFLSRPDEADPAVTVLDFYNLHGIYRHNGGMHVPSCETAGVGALRGWRNTRTRTQDEEKEAYAAALTAAAAAAGHRLRVAYSGVYECQLFHRRELAPRSGGAARYSSVRKLLEAEHPGDVVLGGPSPPPPSAGGGRRRGRKRKWTQSSLVREIMEQQRQQPPTKKSSATPTTSTKRRRERLAGFLVVCGGRETETDDGVLPGSMGYCHQRRKVGDASELGPFAEDLALRDCGGDEEAAARLLARQSDKEMTMTRCSFHDEGEVLELSYFAFLVEQRKLSGYTVKHFLQYCQRDYLTPFVDRLLQRRHDLRDEAGADLERQTAKLFLNGTYGYSMVETTSYTSTKIWRGSDIRKSKAKRKVLASPDLVGAHLLGCVEPEGAPADLLYAVTSWNSDGKIFNACQTASFILGNSRRIFLGLVLGLHRLMDPARFEACYYDTDSCIYACTHAEPRDNVREDRLEEFDGSGIFEDKGSSAHQAGRLKVEGTYSRAYFRNLKTYHLGEDCVRVRGIPRKTHSDIPVSKFGCYDNALVVRSVALRPTEGFQIAILRESRSLPSSINLKRFASVSARSLFRWPLQPRQRRVSLVFQDCVHSTALP